MRVRFLFHFSLTVLLLGCGTKSSLPDDSEKTIFVSIEPYAFLAERVAGDRFAVEVLVPAGKSPATYAPTPQQVTRVCKSRALFHGGLPFEDALIPKIESAGGVKSVDLLTSISLRQMEGSHQHSPGEPPDEEEHEGNDPHVWLNPENARIQAKTICDTLSQIDAEGAAFYQKNYETLAAELDALDAKLREALAPLKGQAIYVFHPSFGYFADAYGLRQTSIEVEGKALKGKDMLNFIKQAKADDVHILFVQPQFDRIAAESVANALGDAVVEPLDPLAYDYLANLETMAESVIKALGNKKQHRVTSPKGEQFD